ncbi:MAG: hypothetical protein ACRD2W_17895 [Acidimicrobiales bacterium]
MATLDPPATGNTWEQMPDSGVPLPSATIVPEIEPPAFAVPATGVVGAEDEANTASGNSSGSASSAGGAG